MDEPDFRSVAACLSRYWWDAFGCAACAPYLRSTALARSASLRSHALSRAIPKDFPFRLFSPLSRLRERGGGEGRRINRINPCASTSSPAFDDEQFFWAGAQARPGASGSRPDSS
ncbi:hypothetical protein CBM2592_B10044 [Cupriavidus taiwanensis]|nr:hypothetical protein CBM2588_B10044 [Cupriavidus taiwanensis]SOY59780.1 hypothetical protein CBM2592_B10044 [Cupriavidus taiwanensis]SOY91820.1 hypothetical protein CBM2591_B10044 [Cupriavidus taiwanensis]SOZ73481.1 hypothetical protein CBM2617_B190044 [Cupriavidus taiwanensis]SOZ83370.1 hypothetical protein CBM2618_B10044 [Cupriavidus taiwanensis]